MAISATERTTNVVARVNVYLAALTITGSPEVVLVDERRVPPDETPFVRFTWLPLEGVDAGHKDASTRLSEERAYLVADVYWPESDANRYAPRKALDDVRDALTGLSLDFKDYSSDPGAPVDVDGHPLRAIERPVDVPLTSEDGYTRLRTRVRLRWIVAHPL